MTVSKQEILAYDEELLKQTFSDVTDDDDGHGSVSQNGHVDGITVVVKAAAKVDQQQQSPRKPNKCASLPPRPPSSGGLPPLANGSIRDSVHSRGSIGVPNSPNNHSSPVPTEQNETDGGGPSTPEASGSDTKKKKPSPKRSLSDKLSQRFAKFESVPISAELLSPMQSFNASAKSFASASGHPGDLSPLGGSAPLSSGTTPARRRSVRKSLEGRVKTFDTGTTPLGKPRRRKSVDRNGLLSPQEVRELIKQGRTSIFGARVGRAIDQYEHMSEEQTQQLARLAQKQAAKERQRRLGIYSTASFGGEPTSSEAGRKLAWQHTRARFGEAVTSEKKQNKPTTFGFDGSLHDHDDPEVSAAAKLAVHKNVQAVAYDFSTFQAPSNGPKTAVQRQLILKVVNASFAFAEFRPNGKARAEGVIDTLVEAFEVARLPIGHVLLHQSGDADTNDVFYIVEEGAVDFQKDGVTVGQARVTDWFGEQALLHHEPSKLTVAVAQSSDSQGTSIAGATLLKLTQKNFRGILHCFSQNALEEKRLALYGVDFLRDVLEGDDELVDRLASTMVREEFQKDQTFDAPEATTFLVVQSGEIRLTHPRGGSTERTLKQGDHYGEKVMLGTMRARRSVAAKRIVLKGSSQQGVFFRINREEMEEILGPSRLQNLKDIRRLALSDELLKRAQLTKKSQDIMARNMVEHTFKDEEPKKEETAEALNHNRNFLEVKRSARPALYLVRQGSMIISYHDELTGTHHEKEVMAGEVFGHEQLEEKTVHGFTTFYRIGGLKATAVAGTKASVGVLPIDVVDQTTRASTPISWGSTRSGSAIPTDSTRSIASVSSTASISSNTSMYVRNKVEKAVESNIELDDLEKIRMLGEGQYGEVWLVAADVFKTGKPEHRQKFALKSQFKEDDNRGKDAVTAVKREIDAIKALNHPGVVNLVATFEDESSLYMLMGLIPGGELWGQIYTEDSEGNWDNGLPDDHAKFYTMAVADTLGFMHSKGYIYRDLKPENIMIGARGYPVIVDFGFAKLCPDPDKTYTFVGTPNYVAPEVITNAGHNRSVDYWALGVTLYEMIEGENPFFFDGMSQVDLYDSIVNETPYPMQDIRCAELVDLVDRLLEKDPTKRLGMLANGIDEVLQHSWFDGMDLDRVRSGKWPAPTKPDGQALEEGLEATFFQELQIGNDESEGDAQEEVNISFGPQSQVEMGLLTPSLDESLASLSGSNASMEDSAASLVTESVASTTASISMQSMKDAGCRSNPSSPMGGSCPAMKVKAADIPVPSKKQGVALKAKKRSFKGNKKKGIAIGPAADYKASEFQFVKPESSYTPISNPHRKLHKYDAEVSKIRRYNLKQKLRGMGIDSDDDDDFLTKFINSPVRDRANTDPTDNSGGAKDNIK